MPTGQLWILLKKALPPGRPKLKDRRLVSLDD